MAMFRKLSIMSGNGLQAGSGGKARHSTSVSMHSVGQEFFKMKSGKDHGLAPVQVVADYRKARSSVSAALRSRSDVRASMGQLELGDYELDGRLLFERKTLRDLAASLKDGRLFEQGCRLASSP
jgi:ERCC4-type nuclease